MPDRFIALNILPKDSLEELEKSLRKAELLGFTHVWLNPLAECGGMLTRLDLDTGVHTTLHNSLYAVYSPASLRDPFTEDDLRALNQKFPRLKIMADFVWKHVSTDSGRYPKSRAGEAVAQTPKSKKLGSKKKGRKKPAAAAAAAAPQQAAAASGVRPEWFAGEGRKKPKEIKDVVEYYLDQDSNPVAYREIMQDELEPAVDLLLRDCGFAGLRLDAAAHFPECVRRDLITYIRTQYREALIFEEVLFDQNQEERIKQLAQMNLRSDYVTSNLSFKVPSVFGALPKPEEMGDSDKLKLAALPISFTGNHDHFSLAWETLLTLAAQSLRSAEYENIRRVIGSIVSVSPVMEQAVLDQAKFDALLESLDLALEQRCPESLEPRCPASLDGNDCHIFRFLVPLAHTIADDLCKNSVKSHHYQNFRRLARGYLFHRTLASPGGYFMLEADAELLFETPRIFTNKSGEVLSVFDFTPEKLEGVLSDKDRKDKLFELLGEFFGNFKNFKKNFKELSNQQIAYVLFPYVLTYFRSLSAVDRKALEETLKIELKPYDTGRLYSRLQWGATIKMVNTVFSALATPNSRDYETFVIKDDHDTPVFFAVVRRSPPLTDVVFMPYREDTGLSYTQADLKKLTAWFLARRFPDNECGPLPRPFSPEPPAEPRKASPRHDAEARQKCGAELSGERLSNLTRVHLCGIKMDPAEEESLRKEFAGKVSNIQLIRYSVGDHPMYNPNIELFVEEQPAPAAAADEGACAAAANEGRKPWSPRAFSPPPATRDLERSISLGRGGEGSDLGDEGQRTPPPTRRSPHSAPTSPEKPGKLKQLAETQVETRVISPPSFDDGRSGLPSPSA